MATVSEELHPAEPDLAALLKDLRALEELIDSWDEPQRNTVSALKHAVDALHKTALTRLIRAVKSDPAGQQALRAAVTDEVVYSVLRHHELIKPSLHERIEQALASVRPMLASHGGDVELVQVILPDGVEIRLLGTCDGCPASALTLSAGVEKAIQEHCPEITRIRQAKGQPHRPGNGGGEAPVHFVSPFARNEDSGWLPACSLSAVPEGGVVALDVAGEALLLSRLRERVVCYRNACAHLGMPLDLAEVRDGILTCPHHGFQYALESGECLTVPEVQLQTHAVRVRSDRVEVKLS